MPHVNSQGEDLASSDEVKVYAEVDDDQHTSNEQLIEDKKRLVTESERLVTESERGKEASGSREYRNGQKSSSEEKSGSSSSDPTGLSAFAQPYGWYPPNSPVNLKPHFQPHHPLFYNDLTPPPAHTGVSPMDIKAGLRPVLFGATQLPFYPELAAHMAPPWTNGAYPRAPYPYHQLAAAAAASRYPSSLLHPGFSQQALLSPGGAVGEVFRAHHSHSHSGSSGSSGEHTHHNGTTNGDSQASAAAAAAAAAAEKKKPHIKKPLNAFMLFMKDNRASVVSECTLKESAAINQILGRKWHALDKVEQAKYYDMAKKEREHHMKMYPGWSARDNYALHSKKKKRRREPQSESKAGPGAGTQECSTPKKCRATFGLDEQNQWCKSCRSAQSESPGSAADPVPPPAGGPPVGHPGAGTVSSSSSPEAPPPEERKSAPDS